MKTQALGWLAAAVLAAGLNATYHDGGLEWAHQIADRVEYSTSAVLALATGRADQFLAETRILAANEQARSCPLATALARVESKVVGTEAEVANFDRMTAREEAQLARIDASRARMEAQLVRVRIPATAFDSVIIRAPRISVCPRVRVNVPQLPVWRMPAVPVVHLDAPGAGPV